MSREQYRRALAKEQARLHDLSIEARKRGVSTVLAFEGWDAAGRAVSSVASRPLWRPATRVIPVAAPSQEERKFHYLWRFWRDLPPAGKFVIFDRTWYGRVLVGGSKASQRWQSGKGLSTRSTTSRANWSNAAFTLRSSGCTFPRKSSSRGSKPVKRPRKKHKITEEDYRNRERWHDYVKAVDQMILRTASDGAKWHVIPANDKYFARVATLKAINKGLARTLRQTPAGPPRSADLASRPAPN